MGAFHAANAAPVYSIRPTLTGLDVNRALSATTTMKDVLLGNASVTANLKGSGCSALFHCSGLKASDGGGRRPG